MLTVLASGTNKILPKFHKTVQYMDNIMEIQPTTLDLQVLPPTAHFTS